MPMFSGGGPTRGLPRHREDVGHARRTTAPMGVTNAAGPDRDELAIIKANLQPGPRRPVSFEVVSALRTLWQLGRRDPDPFMGEGLEVGD